MLEKRFKYARVEIERRFLLAALPAELDPRSAYQTFEDRYFLGTSLRLRRVTSPSGEIVELTPEQHKAFVDAVTPIYGEARSQYGKELLSLVNL